MNTVKPRTGLVGVAVAGLFLALTVAVGLIFLTAYAPRDPATGTGIATPYSPEAMEEALSPAAVRKRLDQVLALGSRMPGQPGFRSTETLIREAYASAGLRVIELPQRIATPVTRERIILDAEGRPLDGVEVYPFQPNHFQPIVTPTNGLSGPLLLVTDDVLQAGVSFEGMLAVVDLAAPPRHQGADWLAYAKLGFAALIITHRDGLEAMDWERLNVVSSTPVNYCRLAATPGILAHLDKPVTLRVHVDWREVLTTTFVGIRAGAGRDTGEALVQTASYDAFSPLPDLAPGTLSAMNLAVHLSVLDALPSYPAGGLQRDLIFVAYASQYMAHLAADRLTAVLGPARDRRLAERHWAEKRKENARQEALVRDCLALAASPDFLRAEDSTRRGVDALGKAARTLLDEELRYLLNTVVRECAESQLEARLAFMREGERVDGPAYAVYRERRRAYDDAMTVAGYPVRKLVESRGEGRESVAVAYALGARLQARLTDLAAHHEAQRLMLDRTLELHQALSPYARLAVLTSRLMPSSGDETPGERVSFGMDASSEWLNYANLPVINDVLNQIVQGLVLPPRARFDALRQTGHDGWAAGFLQGHRADTAMWNAKGFPAFYLLHTDRSDPYMAVGVPVERPYMRNTQSMAFGLRLYAHAMLALSHGTGQFERPQRVSLQHYGGRVFQANVGRALVPNYPLQHAVLGHRGITGSFSTPWLSVPFYFADVYGRYDMPFCGLSMVPGGGEAYSPQAIQFGADGLIACIKDEGQQGQSVYKSTNVGWGGRDRVNIVTFRAAPLTVLDTVNPQTLRSYSSVGFLNRSGLAPVNKFNVFADADSLVHAYLEPDQRVYLTFRSGAPENDLVQTVRAFALNHGAGAPTETAAEIDGEGYLVSDTPQLRQTSREAARSMLAVDGRRLALQERYHMADAQTRAFHRRGAELLAASEAQGLTLDAATRLQRDAATYAILNHPVLRRSVSEAVVGILWYLGLLVPFVFFFEKLVFGFADIRRQLAAQACIFLVVFGLLRVLHPAFHMIQSSLMILLGFVIMLISGAVTLLFSGKFGENLEELRKKRGKVAAAEVNTMGVMAAAFSLGLNNMHRRLVRTGLTCATLVLLTFAMICFTSVSQNMVNTLTAVGRAPYQGLLVKRPQLTPISAAERGALQEKFGRRHRVVGREMLTGVQGWDRINRNPTLEAVYEPVDREPVKLPVASVLTFSPHEPLQHGISLLTRGGWFQDIRDASSAAPMPVLIPDRMAERLNISPSEVDAGGVGLKLNGLTVRVQGIFTAASLEALRDLDGRDLLPFDLEAMTTVRMEEGAVVATDKDPRLPASQTILAPEGMLDFLRAENSSRRLVSIAVTMPDAGYADARAEIDQYLEHTGQETYLGLDDIVYRGQRARVRSLAGLLELLIPLVIAAMTVLNTMRGSVYERRDEIFVYNAVGIAPRYIFGMFLSEAFVYAVVGSVLGYLLSQGTGRLLTVMGWTGGLNMTFTSLSTLYASLAIMAAVFLSTLFPARSAMRIAAPADDAGWTLPEPEEDRMSFALPFTFDAEARVAVLAFCRRYLLDHGEGSSADFYAGLPRCSTVGDPLDPRADAPRLSCTTWLKPFDLGVSQELAITLPRDPETGEYIATVSLTRRSGSRESWLRLTRHFVQGLRQHFLYWRAVGPLERKVMFHEAQEQLVEERAEPTGPPA